MFLINENQHGCWIKINNLILQYGKIPEFGYYEKQEETYFIIDLPIAFKSKESYSVTASYWGRRDSIFQLEKYSNNKIRAYVQLGTCYLGNWIAIGY